MIQRNSALLHLLARNRANAEAIRKPLQAVRSEATDSATVYLYAPIVGDEVTAEWAGGVCPQQLVPVLHSLGDVGTIDLRVNSPGGDVFAAEAIAEALRAHPGKVVAHIDGLAASAATTICCAAREVVASRGSKYMIHQAWTLAMGNATDLRAVAELLDQVDGSMASEYVRFSGADLAQVTAWMGAETWFSAQQAVTAGFVHSITDHGASAASARAGWDLSAYSRATAEDPDPMASHDHRARQMQRISLMRARYTAD